MGDGIGELFVAALAVLCLVGLYYLAKADADDGED